MFIHPDLSIDPTPLVIANRTFSSRLMTGTGKYPNFVTMRKAIAASGSKIVTVASDRSGTKSSWDGAGNANGNFSR